MLPMIHHHCKSTTGCTFILSHTYVLAARLLTILVRHRHILYVINIVSTFLWISSVAPFKTYAKSVFLDALILHCSQPLLTTIASHCKASSLATTGNYYASIIKCQLFIIMNHSLLYSDGSVTHFWTTTLWTIHQLSLTTCIRMINKSTYDDYTSITDHPFWTMLIHYFRWPVLTLLAVSFQNQSTNATTG